jgi:riboflavin kinase/FMN adenylyltransferase
MELVRGLHNLRPRHRGCVLTIGNYDGVHRGHQHMIAAVQRGAREFGVPATVLTFEPTPREFFQGARAPARLTRLREKLEALAHYGVDRTIVARFTEEMSRARAHEFVGFLVGELGIRRIVVGDDFRFGRERTGTVATLREAGLRDGFDVEQIDPFVLDGERVSSSLVRSTLEQGDLDRATRLLGRPYRITGRVQLGRQLGRTLGFPTANLALHRKVIPLWGIFAVRVHGGGLVDHPAVASLGTRPTVDGTEPLLEVHAFDFSGDLYGKLLRVDFIARLRDEHKFATLDALVAQMHVDAAEARQALERAAGACK